MNLLSSGAASGVFTAAPHADILAVLIQITILLFTARALGELALRLNQPAVVGEILAGIILGPSLLSDLFPVLGQFIVPQNDTQGYLLEFVSLLGAMSLMLVTGLETDVQLIKRHARTAMSVSLGGITCTFATGFLLGQYLPDDLLADKDQRLVFALFLATAMSISAIPVIAKVLIDLKLIRRDVGQTIIAAGMTDDTIGWILLSIVVGIATSGAFSLAGVATSVGSVIAFLVISFTVGSWLARKGTNFIQDRVNSPDRVLSFILIFAFGLGAFATGLNFEAVLGAFITGILFSRIPTVPSETIKRLESIAMGKFAPIFFATAGLKVNIKDLADPVIAVVTLIVIAVASLGKVAGTYIGARFIGRKDHWTALSFGAGLNARGAMEIIIATIGLSFGILSQQMFSVIVVMAIVTSLAAPPLLRYILSKIDPKEEELKRLEAEERRKGSLIANVHRVLVPVRHRRGNRPGKIQEIEARLLSLLPNPKNLAVTLMTVVQNQEKQEANRFLSETKKLFSTHKLNPKISVDENPLNAILNESHRDYDLIFIGAAGDSRTRNTLFNPLIDSVVRMAPVPSIVVRPFGAIGPDHDTADPGIDMSSWPKKILVPTNGSREARNAAEFVFSIAPKGSQIMLLNVIKKREMPGKDLHKSRQYRISYEFIGELKSLAASYDCNPQGLVVEGHNAYDTILDWAATYAFDMVVLGTGVRAGTDHLYFGPSVERILQYAECAVLILNSPA